MTYDTFRQQFWKLANAGLCKLVKKEKAQIGHRHYYTVAVDDEKEWKNIYHELTKPKGMDKEV